MRMNHHALENTTALKWAYTVITCSLWHAKTAQITPKSSHFVNHAKGGATPERQPVKQVVKEFCQKAASQGDFSLGKFNVIPDCFCRQPIGTLINRMWGNPDYTATGKVLGSKEEKPDVVPSKATLNVRDLGPHLTHSSLGSPESTSQTVSRLVQPFLQGSRSL